MRILFSFGSPKEVPKDDQEKNKTETPSLPSVDLLDSASVLIPAARDWIKLSNIETVTIGIPVTFTVKIHHSTDTPSYQVRFKFSDFPNQNINISSTSNVVNYTVTFESTPKQDSTIMYYHIVNVDAWYCPLGVPSHEIGSSFSRFILSDSLSGFINVTQDILDPNLGGDSVSTTSPVKLSAKIHHSAGFFDSAIITYKWVVNGSPQEDNYDFIVRNFSQPKLNNISVLVSVSKTNPVFQKTELFTRTVHSKDPIQNLTTDGQNNIQLCKDETLQLNIKINGGTPTFYYCWEITNSSTAGRNTEPLSESLFWRKYFGEEPTNSSECEETEESSFNINSHFEEAGNKTLYIAVSNVASYSTKIMTISVHEREPLRQPEISDKEIESYLRSKNEIEFIKDMLTDFHNSSWKD
ncbi:uncharacterized protein LOC107362157 isoform X1 [Tetranychus urticae]|uniref:uncharacterized protein LOC107362157 isoform X1 n=1 Tax=Tetranychus urticae TaxID=32264 RepID=UPI000D65563A|nr:uncharacterized protein LOC107362157 isoform X1 [Tetranychus urticae]